MTCHGTRCTIIGDERSLHWNFPSAYLRRFKRNSRAHDRTYVKVQGHTRSRGTHSRDVISSNRDSSEKRTVLTWDRSESSRILASMVTWLAWILGVATTRAAANRNVSIVLAAMLAGTGETIHQFTRGLKRSPRGRSTRIDHRWIIDESQRDTDTALAKTSRTFSTDGDTVIADKRTIICASAIINADSPIDERARDRARSFLFPFLFPPLFLTAISLSVAALFPLDVSTIRRIARYCALSMPQPLLPPTNLLVATSLRRGSRVSPSSLPYSSYACDRREHVTSPTFSLRSDRVARITREIL